MQYRRIIIHPSDGFFKEPERNSAPEKQNYRLHILLFIATLLTTTFIGAAMEGGNPFVNAGDIAKGLPFSLTLLLFLGTHEFGHYFAAKRWNVRVTLPYFIPAPFPPIGTFGAVIKMRSAIPSRKALIDVGAAGPLAGFVVAVAASIIGLHLSDITTTHAVNSEEFIMLGDSLAFKSMTYLVYGPLPENADISLHPVAFAGWLGLFVTALNLLPIGQLDGGHILFAISPHVHEMVRRIRIPLLLLLGFTFWSGWFVWAIILLFIGQPHPYPRKMEPELDAVRKTAAAAALIIFILCMMPAPVIVG